MSIKKTSISPHDSRQVPGDGDGPDALHYVATPDLPVVFSERNGDVVLTAAIHAEVDLEWEGRGDEFCGFKQVVVLEKWKMPPECFPASYDLKKGNETLLRFSHVALDGAEPAAVNARACFDTSRLDALCMEHGVPFGSHSIAACIVDQCLEIAEGRAPIPKRAALPNWNSGETSVTPAVAGDLEPFTIDRDAMKRLLPSEDVAIVR